MKTREFESFLGARLDEDWHDANEQRGIYPHASVQDDGAVWLNLMYGGNALIVWHRNPAEGWAEMRALKVWASPAGGGWSRERVLGDTEAKQAILKLHFRRRSPDWDHDGIIGWECAQCSTEYPCRTLRLTAAPYAEHPAYRKEWADRD